MEDEFVSETLKNAIVELEEEQALSMVRRSLEQGVDPLIVVEECRRGLEVIGERFSKGEYFLSELVVGGEIFKEAMEILGPAVAAGKEGEQQPVGTVVLGTVKGDIHDLGKNIVGTMLQANGFKVHDLGVDVPAQSFVDKVRESGARVVALSALLTISFDTMKETVAALSQAGLREQVRIMVGGGPVDDSVRAYVGADAYGRTAIEAVDLAKSYVGAAAR